MPRQKKSNERLSVNLTDFAKLCGVSSSTVHEWINNGGMPKTGGGGKGRTVTIYLDEAMPWLIEQQAKKQ